LRAGLLSDKKVIDLLNRDFVSTTIIIDDAEKRAANGDPLAKELAAQWQYPLEMIFLTPAGKPVSKLNSFQDFPGVHPDVVAPPKTQDLPGAKPRMDEHSHRDIFLKHLARYFESK
jgi:hypothetical protein